MAAPTAHRVWKTGSIALMLVIALQLILQGFLKPREILTQTSEPLKEHGADGRKVIYMLFDALREDFISWPESSDVNLDPEGPHAYQGKQISLFQDLVEAAPENAILLPLKSESPTVTVVRIKGFLSGVLNTVFEFTESLISSQFTEDNILSQLHQKHEKDVSIVFYGDEIWAPRFGKWFTRYQDWSGTDINDLDTHDRNVAEHVLQELDNGSDFELMLIHMIGVDSAGHSHGSRHPEVERKLLETQSFIERVIDKMDEQTTLVVFGDHGMTADGSHGGSSELEMHTALFAYQKEPFPFAKKYLKHRAAFEAVDQSLKQVDLAAIGSVLVNVPFPFSNLGVMHPAFAQTDSVRRISALMRQNLEQVDTYLRAFCQVNLSPWCEKEISLFEAELAKIDSLTPVSDAQFIDQMVQMSELMNKKYEHFKSIWIGFDSISMQVGLLLLLHLFLFHQYVSFGKSQTYQDVGGVVGLSISVTTYGGSLLGLYPLLIAAAVSFIISTGQSWRQRHDYWRVVYSKVVRSETLLTPKGLVYPGITLLVVIGYIVLNASDQLVQEQDYAVDSLLLLCLGLMWVTQPAHLRHHDVKSIAVIVLCLKAIYFCDTEHGVNFLPDLEGVEARLWVQDKLQYAQVVPLLLCILLENKIAHHYSFGLLQKLQAHSLTAALIAYQGLLIAKRDLGKAAADQYVKAEKDEQAQLVGYAIYMGVAGCICLTTVHVKFLQGKTWDNVAVRCGLLLAKAAMLVAGRFGPLLYFCMIMQIYNFALIINKRRDSSPGVTLPIQIFFAVLTMQIYWLRSGHRERMNTLQVGRVCPGETSCPEMVHHALLLFDIAAPYLIGHLTLPLIVKARVQHAYANTLKHAKPKARPAVAESGKAVEEEDAAEGAPKPTPRILEYMGNMELGMAIVVAITLVQVTVSGAFVWWAKDELIFADRIAPKYVFDIGRAMITLGFAAFWM